jgi:hypothetical protein
MKNSEFITLAIANAVKTSRIRCYDGRWYTGASRLPCDITSRIGSIISLLHAQIDQGKVGAQDEMLLLYNFQALHVDDMHLLISIDLLIKPLTEIKEVDKLVGKPISLTLNCKTGEVINASQSLLILGLITMEEIYEENMEEPIVYGNYHDFNEYVCYIPTTREEIIDILSLNCISDDNYSYSSFLDWPVFYNFVEAKLYLLQLDIQMGLVAEIECSKDEFHCFGLEDFRQRIVKLIDFSNSSVEILQDRIGTENEEVKELHEMMSEASPNCSNEWEIFF